ncbi:ATP-binding protein [Pedobacter sp. KR3-3]|uniref:ATP-binding protein n=1 Tax=Pedobacter albus TaxID=3113905 RepID=A0ABU7I5F9_9SPHI|nr:ATP-binding protein [Pedobacter sp. KR3-3]MEE1944499.1 ATP-binding protein [Pedobacter sp. KR3-3]
MEHLENATTVLIELHWLDQVIEQVICSYLLQEGHENNWYDIPVPDWSESATPYASMVNELGLDIYQRLTIAMAMAPHVRPEILDVFFGKNARTDRGYTEFGGVIAPNHSGFLPTGQTICFLLTALDPANRQMVSRLFQKENSLMKEQIVTLGTTDDHIPKLNGILSLSESWLHYFYTGQKNGPEHSSVFPAKKITTPMSWEDVVLDDLVREQLAEITTWLSHGELLMSDWGFDKKIKPGYRALFYGPPGTGKTLTATLLGKATQRDVYRVDLSMIVSKYIGETEKNLSRIFEVAKEKKWILFFDEADALFGKRTTATSSNDRHANQQTAYLLQQIEDFPGVVILASNLKGNMDEAFSRRFQSTIYFGMPSPQERQQLWNNAFSGKFTLSPEIDLQHLAEEYEIAGGSIINILRYCALSAIRRNSFEVSQHELLTGLKREFKKENKTLNLLTTTSN